MKKIISLATALSLTFTVFAQNELRCASDVKMRELFAANPTLKAKMENKNKALRTISTQHSGNYTIPVVFHILHLGGSENISDAQVIDQMRIMNIDYAKQNADTVDIIPSFKTIADSTNIRFELATKDPNGNCTNGIVHYYDANSNWNDQSATLYNKTWNPAKYMNVYVVKSIKLSSGFGAAGYTWLPGTWNTGDAQDAIVVLDTYIGSIGTSNPFSSRVLTHEVGHWLDLNHTFGWNECGANCNNDDYVYDTPTSKGYLSCPNLNAPTTYQLCSTGVDENFQNFMDYSYCEKMFTHGQAQRMQAALQSTTAGRSNLWSAANLTATGVTTPTLCTPVADFKQSKNVTCVNVPVTFTDVSTNAVPTSYSWTFQGGTPATSTNSTEQVTYTTPGIYTVSLTVGNTAGNNTITKTGSVHILSAVASLPVASFNEGFENNTTFTQNWITLNSNNDNKYFQTTSATSFTGNSSLLINNSTNADGGVDEVYFPPLDFTGVTSAALSFRYAYTPMTATDKDKLELYMQTNCNLGFVGTPRYTRTANTTNPTNDLSPIAGNFTFGNYVPVRGDVTEWKLVTLSNLSAAYGNGNVLLKYVFTEAGGNNLYIDDIQLTTNLTPNGLTNLAVAQHNVQVKPNPSQGLSTISFVLTQASNINIAITNTCGQTIQTIATDNLILGEHSYAINTSALASGFYLIELTANGNKVVQKLIVE